MKQMATYGSLTHHLGEKDSVRKIKIQIHEAFLSDYFKYRHAVDDHNNLRHPTPTLEDTWVTTRCVNSVLAFVLYWNTSHESRVSVTAAPGSHPSEDEVAG